MSDIRHSCPYWDTEKFFVVVFHQTHTILHRNTMSLKLLFKFYMCVKGQTQHAVDFRPIFSNIKMKKGVVFND